MTADSNRCVALTKAGQRCSWPARFSDQRCHVHSATPEGTAMRRAIGHLGATGKRPARLTSLDDALNYASWAANEFARKRLTVEQMKAVDQLLTTFAALIKARDQDAKFEEMKRMLEEAKVVKGGKGK